MRESYEFKKPGIDKITLLGLFVLALLLAHLIVLSKKTVRLNKPVELHPFGLSISLPTGAGWRAQSRWTCRKNAYQISSLFASTPDSFETVVNCTYSLAPLKLEPDDWFNQIASSYSAQIINKDTIITAQPDQNLTFSCARLKADDRLLDIRLATTELPYGKRLDIELHNYSGDSELAEETFKKVLQNAGFQDNKILAAAASVVDKIKKTGIDNLLEANQNSFFLIENLQQKAIGFTNTITTTSAVSEPFSQDRLNAEIADYQYIRDAFPSEHLALFKCNGSISRFSYKSETASLIGRTGHEIILDPNGIVTLKSSKDRPRPQKFRPSSLAVPNLLLDQVLIQMLTDNQKTMLIEMINYDGKIIPALITKKQQSDNLVDQIESHTFNVELLDGSGFTQQIYLDSRPQISKALLFYDNKYILVRCSQEKILNLFPEKAGYLLRKITPLQQE